MASGPGSVLLFTPSPPSSFLLRFFHKRKILNLVFRFAYYRQRHLTFCLIHPVLFYWIPLLPYLVSHSLTDYCFWILPNFRNWHHATSPCVIFYNSIKLTLNNALGPLCLWQCFFCIRPLQNEFQLWNTNSSRLRTIHFDVLLLERGKAPWDTIAYWSLGWPEPGSQDPALCEGLLCNCIHRYLREWGGGWQKQWEMYGWCWKYLSVLVFII